jgi:hypothetical protein
MGRSMNERDLHDNTSMDMIPEQDENITGDPNSMNYNMSMNTNMRHSMPQAARRPEADHYEEYFNQWAQSLNN